MEAGLQGCKALQGHAVVHKASQLRLCKSVLKLTFIQTVGKLGMVPKV